MRQMSFWVRPLLAFAVWMAAQVAASAQSAPVSPAVQSAQDQAAIAQANATAATAMTTAQLANQSSEIANIQAALGGIDATKLRLTTAPTVPSVNATFYKIMGVQVLHWLRRDPKTPISQVPAPSGGGDATVIIDRPVLQTLLQLYSATSGKLNALYDNISTADARLQRAKAGSKVKTAQTEFIGLAGAAAVTAVTSLVANIVAAAKPVTALGSFSEQKAMDQIVVAALEENATKKGMKLELYDPDLSIDYSDSSGTACPSQLPPHITSLDLLEKASCVSAMIDQANKDISKESLPAVPPKPKKDPRAIERAALATLVKVVDQSTAEFQTLLTANAQGAVPFNIAMRGETFHKMLSASGTCILSLNVATADADVVVRDGTFTAYKLSVATTTTIDWTLAQEDGQIIHAGVKILTTPWKRQSLN